LSSAWCSWMVARISDITAALLGGLFWIAGCISNTVFGVLSASCFSASIRLISIGRPWTWKLAKTGVHSPFLEACVFLRAACRIQKSLKLKLNIFLFEKKINLLAKYLNNTKLLSFPSILQTAIISEFSTVVSKQRIQQLFLCLRKTIQKLIQICLIKWGNL
jgi:hypothetical protein